MTTLADFPITKKWPAQHPDRIQLYSFPTPNGIKVSAALEETGLPYEAHTVSFATDDQLTPEFISLNPNNKIPAIIDPNGPGGAPNRLVVADWAPHGAWKPYTYDDGIHVNEQGRPVLGEVVARAVGPIS